jgi:nucleotide-binding universal stress UspA family protein
LRRATASLEGGTAAASGTEVTAMLGSTVRFERIVVGVDASAASRRALSWAAGLARGTGAEIVAVHVIHPPWHSESVPLAPVGEDIVLAYKRWRTDMERVVREEWCAALDGVGVEYSTHVLEGGPAALLGVANREDADAIVVGRSGRSGFTELLLGSFSHHIVHHSSIPVIVVPAKEDG